MERAIEGSTEAPLPPLSEKELKRLAKKVGMEIFLGLLKMSSDCKEDCDAVLDKLLADYADVVVDELPNQLPPKRSIDHVIELEPGVKPPTRPLY